MPSMEIPSDATIDKLIDRAHEIRCMVLDMLVSAGGGHYGGSLSIIEILVALYEVVMRVNPSDPAWPDRDRLVLSKGHACAALCAVLASRGYFDRELLSTFNQMDSPFGMHPDMNKIPGCDMSTGSLGHGLAVGIGMALAAKADRKQYYVYTIIGDGECNEGSIWESAMVASHYRLSNLIVIIDRNKLSLDGPTEEVMSLEPFSSRWKAFGWQVLEIDGHDFRQIFRAIDIARQAQPSPTAIVAQTVKGRGISFMEGKYEYHYASLGPQEIHKARVELGIKPQ
jgi:transketolase